MGTYSNISKIVGWSQDTMPVPSVKEITELREKVRKGDIVAFERVFRMHRRCVSPSNEEEVKAHEILWDAYAIGCKIHK